MRCEEARRLLALDLRRADPDRVAAAHAHVVECSACQARLDQLSVAVLSGYGDEIPCVECRARMDAYAAAHMSEQGARRPEDHPVMRAHLASCPECAEDYRLLLAALATLGGEAAPAVEAPPPVAFDLSFARHRAPGSGASDSGAPARTDARPRLVPRRPRVTGSNSGPGGGGDFPSSWRERLAAALAGWLGGAWAQQASRGALAGLAAVVLLLFAWLLVFDPQLPEPIESLRPSRWDTETPAPSDVSATQTMAVLMGVDWVDSAEGSPSAGTGTAGTPRTASTERATPTGGGSWAGTPTARAGDEERDSDRRDLDAAATRVSEPSGLRGSAPITPTLDGGAIIGYPPPLPKPTRRAYPGPEDPDPPGGSPTPGSAATPGAGGPSATPAQGRPTAPPSPRPEPSDTPGAAGP